MSDSDTALHSHARQGEAVHWLAQVGAAMALALGLSAGLGWLLPWPLLATLGSGRVPMGPAAAVLFVLYGATVLAAARPAHRTGDQRWIRLAGAIGTVVSIAFLISSSHGPQPSADTWRSTLQQSLSLAPWRHLSPLTALGFVLAGGSVLLALIPSTRRRPWHAFIGSCCAGLIISVNGVFAANQLSGAALAYLGMIILPALPTALAFVSLGTGLLALGLRGHPMPASESEGVHHPRLGLALLGLFVLGASSLFGMGALYLRHLELTQRSLIQSELDAVSSLKVGELASWRAERLADAVALSRNTLLGELAQHSLANPSDQQARQQLHDWLQGLLESGSYHHVFLTDLQLVPQLVIPAASIAPAAANELAIAYSRDVAFIDFHRESPVEPGEQTDVHLELAIALHGRQSDKTPVALLSLRIDPYHFLFPFIRRWPTEQRTGETLLVRREGDEVVFLNDVRFQNNPALGLRLSTLTANLPAAWAAAGHEGAIRGQDYRGVPVMAHTRPVPGSPWFLVAKIDESEAMAPIMTPFILTTGLTSALLLACALGVGLLWRRQNLRTAWAIASSARRDLLERQRSEETLRLSEENLAITLASIGDGVIATDAHGQITRMNTSAERLTGWTLAEAEGRPLPEVFRVIHAHTREPASNLALQVMTQGKTVGLANDTVLLARDGSEYAVFDSAAPICKSDGEMVGVVLVFQDVTERYQAQQALRLSNQRFRDLVNSTEGIVWEADASTFRFTSVSSNAERILGYPVADWLQPGFWPAHIHGDDRDHAVGYCTACTSRCEDHEFEYRFLAADGREVWLRDTVKIVKDNGNPLWLRGLMIDISSYKQTSLALQASLQDKMALLSEVHHRVKNNLQVIASLLRLEARGCPQPEAQSAFNDMQERIHSMAVLHEALYRSGTFAAIDLGDYLARLARQAFRSHIIHPDRIELALDLASVQVTMDQALPCGLLVNELLSNCLKHGFPDGHHGKVSIELHTVADGTALQLRVSDNGIGLPADFEHRRPQSLGLQLVDDLAGQLQGSLEIGPLPAAVFTLQFTIDPHAAQVSRP